MDYLRQFLQRQNYPADAQTCLLESAEKLQNTPCAAAVFQQYIADYRSGTLDYALANEAIGAAAPAAQVHPYTALLVFYILLCEHLQTLYTAKKIAPEIFDNTVSDLRYKAQECFAVHGVWGTFVAFWNDGFFDCKRFGLGRLQYEISPLPCEGRIGEKIYPVGTEAINIHIPSSGPLRKADCEASFAQAKSFFKKSPALFMCDSWLLYPAHRSFLPPHSSILMLMDFFEIIAVRDYAEFRDAWRIFGKPAVAPYTDLPENTSLQRAFAAWLRAGNPVGGAIGIFEL